MIMTSVIGAGLVWAAVSAPTTQPQPVDAQVKQLREKTIDKAVAFLKTHQNDDGSFAHPQMGIGPTGLAVTALLRSGRFGPDHPVVAKALRHLKAHVQPDGGVYKGAMLHNYTTSVAIMAFAEANKDGRYTAVIDKAKRFLIKLQWDEGEGIESSNLFYGGQGYGEHKRPDLSNTQIYIEAMRAAGLPEDHPAMKKAQAFVSRCQNESGEHNDAPWAGKAGKDDEGGFVYTCANGGESKAGKTANGGLRSYGSMTYAGLKSLIYAGVKRDDPRIKAATDWIRRHYTLDENPGMGQQGLYYYYHTFARTMHVLGEARFVDADGKPHDWRGELVRKLARLQKADGSWVNETDRWYEGDPSLVTSFVLLALSYTR